MGGEGGGGAVGGEGGGGAVGGEGGGVAGGEDDDEGVPEYGVNRLTPHPARTHSIASGANRALRSKRITLSPFLLHDLHLRKQLNHRHSRVRV